MKIATWNVNSVRTRLEHVVNWLQETSVDVLCLQETKVVDDLFPRSELSTLGYEAAVLGQKSYNGVALVSKLSIANLSHGFGPFLGDSIGDLDEQKRVISATIDDLTIVNLYVPNGSAVDSEKYLYKLRWLEALGKYLQKRLQETDRLLVCGDFNVALEDIDIHNSKGREKMVMATDLERQAVKQAVLDLGLTDVFRKFCSEPEQFSWWDYRTGAFRRNAGWRIDHIYLTSGLYQQAIGCTIDLAPRKLTQPSDHTPVIVEF